VATLFAFSQYKVRNEPEWRWWPGVAGVEP